MTPANPAIFRSVKSNGGGIVPSHNRRRIMRGFTKKAMALGLTAGMIAGTMLTGCGGSSSENDQFQYMIATAVDNGFYTEYEDMPVVKYWLDMD